MRDLAAVKRIAIHVEDFSPVECHRDFLTADFDLFVIPHADWPQVPVFGSDAVIKGAVILGGQQRVIFMLFVVAVGIQDLDLESVACGLPA